MLRAVGDGNQWGTQQARVSTVRQSDPQECNRGSRQDWLPQNETSMSLKTHFASSSEPLKEGSTVKAWCEFDVELAQFVLSYDGEFPRKLQRLIEEIPYMLGVCPKCRREMLSQSEIKGRYFYAIRTRAGDKAA